MDSPARLHNISVQQSRNSIYLFTLISTTLIHPFSQSFICSLSLPPPHVLLSASQADRMLDPTWERKEGGGIRGIIGLMGGVKSAWSTTAMRSMKTTPPAPKTTRSRVEQNYKGLWEQKCVCVCVCVGWGLLKKGKWRG